MSQPSTGLELSYRHYIPPTSPAVLAPAPAAAGATEAGGEFGFRVNNGGGCSTRTASHSEGTDGAVAKERATATASPEALTPAPAAAGATEAGGDFGVRVSVGGGSG